MTKTQLHYHFLSRDKADKYTSRKQLLIICNESWSKLEQKFMVIWNKMDQLRWKRTTTWYNHCTLFTSQFVIARILDDWYIFPGMIRNTDTINSPFLFWRSYLITAKCLFIRNWKSFYSIIRHWGRNTYMQQSHNHFTEIVKLL